MSEPRVNDADVIPLHCKQTRVAIFKGTFLFCCPHQAPRFFCAGMMYAEPLEPIRGN